MLKVIIGLLIAGIILYSIFGIWGIIIPAVLFIGIIILAIRNADKNPMFAASVSGNSDSGSSLPFDAEIDVSNIPVSIKYEDKEGTITKRDIEIKKIGIAGKNLYIRGFCRMANEERTFRVDRIIEAAAYGESVNIMVFVSELCKNREEFDKCLLNGINFCITGTLKIMTRRQAQERIEAYGGGFHKYIRYDTHFLVAENAERKTGKLLEAKAHGIPIIDEDTFIDYLSEPVKAQAKKRAIKDQYEYYRESVEHDMDYKKKNFGDMKATAADAVPENENLPLRGLSFCFTGELKTMKRAEAEEKIKALGAQAKSTVLKGLSYLVADDSASGSAKSNRARELGIPVLNEDEFLALLEKAYSQL